jgi:hypothetical protein
MKLQKLGLWQKVLALGAAIGSALTGCVTGGSVTPEIGYNHNIPTKERLEFDSAVSYGVRGNVKIKNKVEIEAEARFHNTNYNDGFQESDANVRDLSIGAVIPVWNNGKVEVYAVPKVISRNEESVSRIIGIPGSDTPYEDNAIGYGLGAGARFKAGKGKVDARLSYEEFGEGTYEKSGLNFSAGYTFEF